MRSVLLRVAALFALCPLFAQQIPIRSYTLDNGLKVLVHEDHDVPNVALYLFFKVGSRNEQPGLTGISHFFEHMMFNGTKKYGPKQFDIQMEQAGGRNNAYTDRDVTVYTDWFPSTALELMFDLESDRMVNLDFKPLLVDSERSVVYSERRLRVDNDPAGDLYEQLAATAFTAHPYQWPVIGWASDIEAWTMEDLKNHYKMGYAPNNATLVLVGDVKAEQVLPLLRKYFGSLPRQPEPPKVRTMEPAQNGERRVELRRAAELPLVFLGFHVPPTSHPDTPALRVLSAVLSTGRSSRLYQRLVEKEQAALSVGFDLDLSLDPWMAMLSLRPRSGVNPRRAEALALEELAAVRTKDVPDQELRKAKNQLLANLYRDLKTIAGKANLIGQYEVFYGGHEKLAQAAEAIEKVTAADVRRVANAYLQPTNQTVATLVPTAAAATEVTQ